jgi:hypothetical protein
MLNLIRAGFAALVLSQIAAAPAVATDKPVTILGEGTVSCGQWLEDRSTRGIPEAVDTAWVRGLLTGLNAMTPPHNAGHDSDPAGNNLWIDTYCKQHPLSMLYDAAVLLWYALRDR